MELGVGDTLQEFWQLTLMLDYRGYAHVTVQWQSSDSPVCHESVFLVWKYDRVKV